MSQIRLLILVPLYSRCLVLVSLAAWVKADPSIHLTPPTTTTSTTTSTITPLTPALTNGQTSAHALNQTRIIDHPVPSPIDLSTTSDPGRDTPSTVIGQSARRHNPSWRRKRRFAEADRETLPGQDPRCDQFIHSVEVVQPRDPSVMTDFFGVSATQKRVKEYQFQTPNWPKPFPFEIDCIKIISAPTKHHRILLNFRGVFELEPEPNCLGDFLEVRDGAFGFSPLLGRFCSRRVPNVGNGIQTTGQYMWLRFRSDSTIPHRGFQAVYRFYETSKFPWD
ncbi:unnamed protein product [Echinostoma caproni]|uniref:CUB domain-containing protein n=1 Tax=Echinostoma caproni TaxID=27848 RepID=A0A183AZU2_9TREM|nr:unnamed protein product [Echinostoma caproni]